MNLNLNSKIQPKERIKMIFTHAQPDRIGVFDFFEDITITNWKKQGLLPNNIDIYDLFDFDLDFRKDKQNKNKFTILSLEGPFQQMIAKKGLQQALMDFSRETRRTKDFFKDTLSNIFS